MEKPGADVKPPVTEGETKGERFPEDDLADIEKKADEEAGSKQDAEEKGEAGEADAGHEDDASVAKLQAFMVKKGIKDIGALVDLTADLESKNTKLSQDVQRLSAIPNLTGGAPAARPPIQAGSDEIELPDNPIELVTDKSKLKAFVQAIRKAARDEYERGKQADDDLSVRQKVAQKMAENPERFQELRPIMYELSLQFPKADIDQIYSMAEKREADKEKALIDKVRANLGLDKTDTDKLRAIVGRVRGAPISSGTGKQVDQGQADEQKANAELLKAIANADKYDS